MSKKNVFIRNKDIGEVSIDELGPKANLKDLSVKIFGEEYKKYFGARINNSIKNLNKKIEAGSDIEFIDVQNPDGYKIFTRTVTAVFIKACKELFPERTVRIEHFIDSGLYTSFEGDYKIGFKDICVIKEKMQEIIDKDYPIYREKYLTAEAIKLFQELGIDSKVRLLKTLDKKRVDVYTIGDYKDTYHGYLAASTGYIKDFELKYYYPGILILFPNKKNPEEIPEFNEQKQLAKVFGDSKRWAEILDLEYLASLNEKIEDNSIKEVIRISEALQEKRIAEIADKICEEKNMDMILIAGPSSSGKTTFANRLSVHLKVNGKKPIIISVDDYFVNRENTPRNEDGSYDFEAVEAINLELLNRDMINLLEGKEIELPKFNFLTGKREKSGDFVKLDEDHPIILEGIHCLNPILTKQIPEKNKFKIYISALTQLNIDAHNRISTRDVRLIRRIVRDNKYRGYSPIKTFELWEGVIKGEEKHIFPFQEEADIMFDSALVYEISLLKKYIAPLLEEIKEEEKYFSEARKLLSFLQYFRSIEEDDSVPVNSILREFIGGMDMDVH